jgi:hypothetical protein
MSIVIIGDILVGGLRQMIHLLFQISIILLILIFIGIIFSLFIGINNFLIIIIIFRVGFFRRGV